MRSRILVAAASRPRVRTAAKGWALQVTPTRAARKARPPSPVALLEGLLSRLRQRNGEADDEARVTSLIQ
jgi:hypothetical protein